VSGERDHRVTLPLTAYGLPLTLHPVIPSLMTSGILFDFNGVIVDDESQHCEALITTLAGYGYALDRDTYYDEYLGFDDRECFRFTFERMGSRLDEKALQEAVARKHAEYERSIRASMRLVPGVSEFIENAALDGFQLAIVSGALRSEIELVLELAGLRPHFAEIVAAEDVGACKPDPQGYNRARARLDLAPKRCVVVEDSLPGLTAARAAGLRCAMLATSHPENACGEADLVWRDFVGHDAAELPWAHG
jgi:beta-phosphoglucomutase